MHEIDGKVLWAAAGIYKRRFDEQYRLYAPTYRKAGGVPRRVVVQAVQERQQANRDALEGLVAGDVVAALRRLYLGGFVSTTCLRAFLPTVSVTDELWREGELFT
jgi:hypothetical protein